MSIVIIKALLLFSIPGHCNDEINSDIEWKYPRFLLTKYKFQER